MMKKLLILMLVFGMASVASATIQISVNGNKDPVDSQIWLQVGQHAIFDIWTDALMQPGVGEEDGWALVADTTLAAISGGSPAVTDPAIAIYDDAVNVGVFPGLPAGTNGPFGSIFLTLLPSIAAGEVIFDQIDFQCLGAGDVTVGLYRISVLPWNGSELVDSVVIHQVPEPMTIALLGFGGLFLLRRRK